MHRHNRFRIDVCSVADPDPDPFGFYRKKSKTKVDIFPILGRILGQDPLFHETDPRIRIHIKMKRIRNTEFLNSDGNRVQFLVS